MNDTYAVGDHVFINHDKYGSKRPMQFALVEKITKTQVTAGGVRFLLNGREVGGDKWHPAIIMPATPELKAKQRELGRLFMAESALEKIGKYILSLRGDDAADVLEGLPSLLKIAAGLKS